MFLVTRESWQVCLKLPHDHKPSIDWVSRDLHVHWSAVIQWHWPITALLKLFVEVDAALWQNFSLVSKDVSFDPRDFSIDQTLCSDTSMYPCLQPCHLCYSLGGLRLTLLQAPYYNMQFWSPPKSSICSWFNGEGLCWSQCFLLLLERPVSVLVSE